ncbi:MAG: radical SAM protein [Pseudomonadota bacterium]
MHVLFVHPHPGPRGLRRGPVYARRFPPVELARIAAVLHAEGVAVELLDAAATGVGPAEVTTRARRADRVFVTSSALDRWCCPELDTTPFETFARAAVAGCADTWLLGAHPTAWPEAMLRRTGARGALLGEPEGPAADLCRAPDPRGLPGLAWLEDGELQRGPARPPVDLDTLPPPAYDLLPGRAYRYELLVGDFMVFELSRGCPDACTFCSQAMYGRPWRMRDPARVAAEVQLSRAHRGTRAAYFMDLEFTRAADHVRELCARLVSLGRPLRWCCQTRVDLVDAPLLATMADAGCELVHFGVESGSQRVLDTLGKGIRLEEAERAVRLTREAGMRSAAFFMLGFPGETRAEMAETLRFSRRLDPDYASFHVAVPYPGTGLYARFRAPPADLFPTHFADDHDLATLERLAKEGFLRFYLRPRALVRHARGADLASLRERVGVFRWYITG